MYTVNDLGDSLVVGGAVDAAVNAESYHKDASIRNEPRDGE